MPCTTYEMKKIVHVYLSHHLDGLNFSALHTHLKLEEENDCWALH